MRETYDCERCGKPHFKGSDIGRRHRKYERGRKPQEPQVSVERMSPGTILMASSDPTVTPKVIMGIVAQMSLREAAGLPEVRSPLSTTVKEKAGAKAREDMTIDGNMTVTKSWAETSSEWEWPDDYTNYNDYLDAFHLVPKITRAIEIKNRYMWQAGYDIEAESDDVATAVDEVLGKVNADVILGRWATQWAQVFGNYYVKILDEKTEDGQLKFEVLNPTGVAVRRDKETREITVYGYRPKPLAPIEPIEPDKIRHFRLNPDPWNPFGYGIIRRVLNTAKAILYMTKYLPEIARMRADPWLKFTLIDPESKMPLPKDVHDKVKKSILDRKPGENLFDDGTVAVEEVYQAANVGGRQTIEGILDYFVEDLIGGLGVPEVLLGEGSTTLKGTASHQEAGFESDVRGVQADFKRWTEQEIFPLLGISPDVSLEWRPLKPEDKDALSMRLRAEIDKGIVTKSYARQLLGYPEWAEMPQDEGEPGPEEPPEEPPEGSRAEE